MFAYFDIGGTKTRIAVSIDGQSFGEPVKFDTPKNFEEGIKMIHNKILSLTNGEALEAVGGGIAGPIDKEHTMLVNSPNLQGWANKSITQVLGSLLGCPVYIENDSAIVALGEAHYGAGKGDEIITYITVSTGVGGARIVNGKIDQNIYGFEPGHQYIDIDRTACPKCKTGVVGDYLSGTSIENRFNKKPYDIEQNNKVWNELSVWLAYMLNNTIVHWSPNSVVLGGSMIVGDPAIPVERVREHLNEICTIYPEKPAIKKATLEDLGGLYGAMVYVRQRVEKST